MSLTARSSSRSTPPASVQVEALAACPGFELPPPRPDELASLRQSLSAKGVLDPIVVSAGPARPGEIADGQARALLASELEIDCPRDERPFASEAEFHAYRLITNLERRKLSDADLIRIGLTLEPHERAQAAQRKAQATGKRRGEKSHPVALPEESGETRERVARMVGLKPSTYSRGAAVLKEGTPELIAALDAGETINRAYQRLRTIERSAQRHALAEQIKRNPPALPTGRYCVLVLDPAWPYPEGMLPYPTMTLEEIAALPVPALLEENAIVWLWTTNKFIFDAGRIATERWQLEPLNILTWDKIRVGTGHWLRGQTEHCLLLSRGKPLFLQGNYTTLLRARAREHSRKPDEFYTLVEDTCPGSKTELFAREQRPGWQQHGAELDLFQPAPDADTDGES